MPPQAFFTAAGGEREGQRFCLLHEPSGTAPRGALVYIHPFAEEMNKSRRMAALQSRALADAGYAVLQIDLHGCGDSSGDFVDATWNDWVADVVLGVQLARARWPSAPLWLWGLRAGCLLAVEAAARLDEPVKCLFWQPMPQGKLALQQFMRLKTAAAMIDGNHKGVAQELKQQLARGESIEIAGYAMSAALASGLEGATLAPPANVSRMAWLEMAGSDDARLSPVGATWLGKWQAAGIESTSRLVRGPAFWQTVEIEEAPALIATTLEVVGAVMAGTTATQAEVPA